MGGSTTAKSGTTKKMDKACSYGLMARNTSVNSGDDHPNGQGTHTWPNGREYVGEFRAGVPDGRGTLTLSNGEKYVGEFKNGLVSGQVTYVWADGSTKSGIWKDGKFVKWTTGNLGIPVEIEGGTFIVPVTINDKITLNFNIDSGASDVSVPADVVSTLDAHRIDKERRFSRRGAVSIGGWLNRAVACLSHSVTKDRRQGRRKCESRVLLRLKEAYCLVKAFSIVSILGPLTIDNVCLETDLRCGKMPSAKHSGLLIAFVALSAPPRCSVSLQREASAGVRQSLRPDAARTTSSILRKPSLASPCSRHCPGTGRRHARRPFGRSLCSMGRRARWRVSCRNTSRTSLR